MFHILLVEDEYDVRMTLIRQLSENIPEADIDAVESVSEGKELIERAAEQREFYDVGILDFMLPINKGESATEIADCLCSHIKQFMPKTLIVHITSHEKDPHISDQHPLQYHTKPNQPQAYMVSKLTNITWGEEVIRILCAYLYGNDIERQIKRCFEEEGENLFDRNSVARNQAGIFSRCGTYQIATLAQAIAAHWDVLDERMKMRVEQYFGVEKQGKIWRVGLKPVEWSE